MFPSTAESSSSRMLSGFSGFATCSTTASSFAPVLPFGTPSSTASLTGNSSSVSFGTPSVFTQANQRGNVFTQGFQTSSPLSNTQTTVTFGPPSSNVHGTSTSGGSMATRSTFNSAPPTLFSSTSSWATNSISTTPVKLNPFGVPTTSNSTTPVQPNLFGVPATSNSTTQVQQNPFGLPTTSKSATLVQPNPFGVPTMSNSTASVQPNPFGIPTTSKSTTPVPNPFAIPTTSNSATPVQLNPFGVPSTSKYTTPVPNPFGVPTTSNSATPVQLNPFGVPTTSKSTAPVSNPFGVPTTSKSTMLVQPSPFGVPSTSNSATPVSNPSGVPTTSKSTTPVPNPFGVPTTSKSTMLVQPSPFGVPSTSNSATPVSNPFGVPTTSNSTTPVSNPFGVPTTSNSTMLVQPNPFGVPTTSNSVTPVQPNPFRVPTTSKSNPFGVPTTSKSTMPVQPNPVGISATLNSAMPVQPNPFGVPTTSKSSTPVSNPFGVPTTSKPTMPNPFGVPTTSNSTTPVQLNPFGVPTTTTAAANSVAVSNVIPGSSSDFCQQKALFNPYFSAQNFNGEKTGITGQTSSSQTTSMEKPRPQVYFEDSKPIDIGISSIPVKDKPTAVRYQALTSRHLSRNKMPLRKYDPKLNAPKIPFFNDTKEIPVDILVPRENPRKLVISPVSCSSKASMLKNIGEEKKASDSLHENEKEDSKSFNCSDDPTTVQELYPTILEVPTKLQQPDYYTKPQISDLEAKERAEPGFCRRVKDFVVGRHGYGSIKFLGETDVRKLDIENLIQFNKREVIVYMDDTKKPAVGEGLNKAAEITLLNIKYVDKKTGRQYKDGPKMNKYIEMLKTKAAAQGAEFMSYDPVEGEWNIRVQHF